MSVNTANYNGSSIQNGEISIDRLVSEVTTQDNAAPGGGKRAGRGRKSRGGKAPAVSGKAVVDAFNTWAFKREQPTAPERLHAAADAAVASGRPLQWVLYWGKGPRTALAKPDVECLDYLAAMAGRVKDVYGPGAGVTLIFTDTHAALNGHAVDAADAYFSAVDQEARKRGFDSCRLGTLVDSAREAGAGQGEEAPSEEILQSLIACATKWYRGEGTTEQGALDYYRMNMLERRAVELAFPEAVFLTFNGSEFRDLFPAAMPIFYMYSLRRGFGVKPWFLQADTASAPLAA